MRKLLIAVLMMVSIGSWADYGVDEDFNYGVDKDFNYGVGSGNSGGQGTVQQPAYPNGGQGGN